jgi:hypothetical protein
VDTGEHFFVVKLYVNEEVDASIEYVIRNVTGDVLITEGSRNIEFKLGRYSYLRNFNTAPFSMKQIGVTGLSLLMVMSVK